MQPSDDTASASTASKPRKRRLFGCLVRGPIGCLAFLTGAILALLVALPFVATQVGPKFAARAADESIEGTVEVDALRIAWFGEQEASVRLLDPDDELVANVKVVMPPLTRFKVWSGDIGSNELRFDIELVTYPDGTTNLERALEPTGQVSAEFGDGSRDSRSGDDWRDWLQMRGRIDISNSRISWTDLRPESDQRRIELADIKGVLAISKSEGVVLRASTEVDGEASSFAKLELNLGSARSIQRGESVEPELVIEASDFPVGIIDALAGANGFLTDVLGEQLTVDVRGSARLGGGADAVGTLVAKVESERLRFEPLIELDEQRIALAPGTLLSVRPNPETLQKLLPDELQARIELELENDEVVRVDIARAAVELPEGWSSKLDEFDLNALAARIELEAEIAMPLVSIDGDALAERGLDQGAKFSGAMATLWHSASDGFEVHMHGAFLTPNRSGGGINAAGTNVNASFASFDSMLNDLAGGHLPLADVHLDISDVPAELIDAALESGELVRDVLGPSLMLSLDVEDARGFGAGDVHANLSSELASADLVGRLIEGRFVAERDGGGGDVQFALTPLSSPKLVGSLLPFVAKIESSNANERAALALEQFALPLSGDLRELDAEVVLDLGQVRINYLAALEGALGHAPSPMETVSLDPVSLAIRAGRVSYEGLGFSVDGTSVAIDGVFDLVTRELNLSTQLPLALVGGDVGRLLEDVRDVLPAETRVPIVITGRPSSPRVGLQPGFMQTIGTQFGDAIKVRFDSEIREGLDELLDLEESLEGLEGDLGIEELDEVFKRLFGQKQD